MNKDYYKVLGVPRTASERDIKSAYRKLARQYHPDVNPGNAQAEERFKEIAEAHDLLSDPEKRRRFDQFGSGGPRAGAGPGRGSAVNWADVLRQSQGQQRGGRRRAPEAEPDMSDLLKDLFGRAGAGRAGGGAGRPRVGENLEQELSVSLEDAFRGAVREFQVEVPDEAGTAVRERIELKIPIGVREGVKLRVAGKGYFGPGGGPRGDLLFKVVIAPHATIERRGDDLHTEVPVAVWDAMLGGEVQLQTLGGSGTFRLPAETQNGRTFRLTGQGMPRIEGGKGDLYAKVKVVLPQELTPREKELIEDLRRGRSGPDGKVG